MPANSSLTIEDTVGGGTLTATAGGEGDGTGAGIGGENTAAGGAITITGGTVTAYGTYGTAGIGGGFDGDAGPIVITGGVVNATGGGFGAGIGSGGSLLGSGVNRTGSITISGGIVTAGGGNNAAGIGGGYEAKGGTVILEGGWITATGNSAAAAIGGGTYGTAGSLDIQGTPETGSATTGGGGPKITNSVTPTGVSYLATTSLTGTDPDNQIDVLFSYLVTFDDSPGSPVASQTVTYNDTAVAPSTPTRTGYAFSGWVSGGTPYDFATPITEPVTLDATWELAAAGTNPTLPVTGVNPAPGVLVGVLLLLIGCGITTEARRRGRI